MKNIPYWHLFVVIYFIIVAIPVYLVHDYLKKRAYANRTFTNLILYFIGILGSAYLLHSICMWFYFTFFFTFRN